MIDFKKKKNLLIFFCFPIILFGQKIQPFGLETVGKYPFKINLFDGVNSTFKWYLNNLNYYSSIKAKDATKRVGLKK